MVSIQNVSKNKHFLLEKKKRKKTKKRKKYDEIEKQVLKSLKTTNSKILPNQIKRGGARENLLFFFAFFEFFYKKNQGVIKGL